MSSSRLFKYTFLPLLIIAVILLFSFSEWIIEYWWMEALGYTSVFWGIKLTKIFLLLTALGIAFLYMGSNAWVLAHNFRFANIANLQLQDRQFDLSDPSATRKIRWALLAITLFISLIFSLLYFSQWDTFFRFYHAQLTGNTDPIFGHDLGFYMFQLPLYELVQSSLAVLTFIVTLSLTIFYISLGMVQIDKTEGLHISSPARKHLSLNLAAWLFTISWGFYLGRYDLLFDSSGVVYGAGSTDIQVILPLQWIITVLTAGLGVYAIIIWFRQQLKGLFIASIGVLAIGIGGFIIGAPLYQSFIVKPNELKREAPYLKHNIKLTRLGYNLDKVNEREYQPKANLSHKDIKNNKGTIDNIRLWDPRLLIQTYKQLQEIRLYYQFYDVDIDRYNTEKGRYQMMLASRELDNELPTRANTWVNRHLQYTHGHGLVMSPVAEEGKEGIPNFVIRDIPPVNTLKGLNVTRPQIYYGSEQPGYKFVNTGVKELDYPAGDKNVYNHYDGKGGIKVNNLFRKGLFAWNRGDINIFLSDYINNNSRFQVWRNVKSRVKRIAPFLQLDKDPYLVLNKGQLYWVQDAYTTSQHFPYSESYNGQFNYIRNSVKVVVNAYNGAVNFYIMNEKDPVIQVYQDMFPDLFKPLSAMDAGLQKHMRYPQDIFDVQIDMYASYHMTNPQVYYNNEDLWKRPNEKYGSQQVKMEPYYLLTKLPGEDRLEYIQIYPMTPNKRDNMIGWIAARSDQPNYGELLVFKLPKDRLIYGPIQIDSRIDQNPEISKLLSLWDQRGSKVIRGNLMVIPIEESFIYVEPVFLISEGVDIPQLQRVIVAYEDRVAMHRTLDESLKAIFDSDKALVDLSAKERDIQPPQQIADTTQKPPSTIPPPPDTTLPTTKFDKERVKELWGKAQQAAQKGDWEEFGRIMDKLKQTIEEDA